MKELSEWLSSNPIIVLIMFLITIFGGVMGIILGWKQFYRDYLSKNLTIPVWLLLICFIFISILFLIFSNKNIEQEKIKELELVQGKTFGIQQVVLDGKRFERCSFDGTEMVFNADNGFSFNSNNMKSNIRITFNKSAALTLRALTALYSDKAFQPFVESTFKTIKEGKLVESTQPNAIK